MPSREVARAPGRAEGRRRREEEGPRQRRFPPPAEVAYEILAGAGSPLTLAEIAAQGAERLLMPDAFTRDANALRAALLEDNRRRESGGRRELFQVDGDVVSLVAQPEPGERPALPMLRAAATPAEARRAGLAALRRRLRECDGPTVEHVACRMLEKLGFHELKVAKRGREHVIYTARRRMGLADVRHGIRILRNAGEVGRREVSELRRDLGHYGAQLGLVVSAGEAEREARGEAGAAGQLPVVLLCGEALAEAFAEAGVGCVQVVVPDVDDAFFKAAAEAAEQEEAARRTRREERDRREGREGRDGREGRRRDGRAADERAGAEPEAGEPPTLELSLEASEVAEEGGVAAPPAAGPRRSEPLLVDATLEEAEGESDEDAPDDELDVEAAPEGAASPAAEGQGEGQAEGQGEGGAAGERRRRRRRRRRRGGRGRGREGAGAGAEGAATAGGGTASEADGGGQPAAEPAPAAPPPEPPAGGGMSE